MTQMKNNQAQAQAQTNQTAKTEKPSTYAINAMRKAIVDQSLNGVNHAITKDEAIKSGTTEERWSQWKLWVAYLRTVALDYARVQADKTIADNSAKMKKAEGLVWKQWRSILKVGEENLFHKNMFVRRTDVEKIVTVAGYTSFVYVPGKGKVPAPTTESNFRKWVETFLACRIAGNDILTDADRDTIKGYNSAKSAEKTARELLDGTIVKKEDGTTETTKGYIEILAERQRELDAAQSVLKKLGTDEKTTETLTAAFVKAVEKAEKDKKEAEEILENAKKRQSELQKRYDEISASLDAIEDQAK